MKNLLGETDLHNALALYKKNASGELACLYEIDKKIFDKILQYCDKKQDFEKFKNFCAIFYNGRDYEKFHNQLSDENRKQIAKRLQKIFEENLENRNLERVIRLFKQNINPNRYNEQLKCVEYILGCRPIKELDEGEIEEVLKCEGIEKIFDSHLTPFESVYQLSQKETIVIDEIKLHQFSELEEDEINGIKNKEGNYEEAVNSLNKRVEDENKPIKEAFEREGEIIEIEKIVDRFIYEHQRDPMENRNENSFKQFDDSMAFLADETQFLIGNDDRNLKNQIKEAFLKINACAEEVSLLSNDEIIANIRYIRNSNNFELKLIPYLREMYYRTTGKFAYSSQLFPIIYSVITNDKRKIAEVSTGQGKSLIIALNSVMEAMCGSAVHITTSTNSLCERDFNENQRFYKAVGVGSAILSNGKWVDDKGEDGLYDNGKIYHSTQSDLYFWLHRQRLNGGENYQQVETIKKVLIADEVDEVMLDNKTLWKLAVSGGDSEKYAEIYRKINEFYAKNQNNLVDLKQRQDENDEVYKQRVDGVLNDLRSFLEQYDNSLVVFLENICGNKELANDKMISLLASAKIASELKEDDDFVIEEEVVDGKVYSVARILKGSGEPDRSSQWSDGVQQLLHCKLTEETGKIFRVKVESLALTGGTTKQLLGYVDKFFGLTGTVGNKDDLELLNQKFGIDSAIKIPTHQVARYKNLPPMVCKNNDSNQSTEYQYHYINSICQDSWRDNPQWKKYSRKNQQRMLIICEDIAEAKKLLDKMKNEVHNGGGKIYEKIQVITGEEEQDELKEKLNLAKQKGYITISTPFSGRGTDILVVDDSPLYVIETCVFPDRMSKQISGRRGRNGQKGKNVAIIDLERYKKGGYITDAEIQAIDNDNLLTFSEKNEKIVDHIKKKIYENQKYEITKQGLISDTSEEIFLKFCHTKDEILKHNANLGVEDGDLKKIAKDLEAEYGNFVNGQFSHLKHNFERKRLNGENPYDINNLDTDFDICIKDDIDNTFKAFSKNVLLKHLKIECDEENLANESENLANEILKKVDNLYNQDKANIERINDERINDERKIVQFDDVLKANLGYSHHGEQGGNVEHKFKILQNENFVDYKNLVLGKNGVYSIPEKQLVNVGNVLGCGYQQIHHSIEDINEQYFIAEGETSKNLRVPQFSVFHKKNGDNHEMLSLLSIDATEGDFAQNIGRTANSMEMDLRNMLKDPKKGLTNEQIDIKLNNFRDKPSIIVEHANGVALISINEARNGDITFDYYNEFCKRLAYLTDCNPKLVEHEILTDDQMKALFVQYVVSGKSFDDFLKYVNIPQKSKDAQFRKFKDQTLLNQTTSLNNAIKHYVEKNFFRYDNENIQDGYDNLKNGLEKIQLQKIAKSGRIVNDFLKKVNNFNDNGINFTYEGSDDYSVEVDEHYLGLFKGFSKSMPHIQQQDGKYKITYTLLGEDGRKYFESRLKYAYVTEQEKDEAKRIYADYKQNAGNDEDIVSEVVLSLTVSQIGQNILQGFQERFNENQNNVTELSKLREEIYGIMGNGYNLTELLFKIDNILGDSYNGFVKQLEIFKSDKGVVIENNDNNEKLRDELNLVDLYPENYNENVSKKKKYGQTNSRARVRDVNANGRKRFAQHEFDKKLE